MSGDSLGIELCEEDWMRREKWFILRTACLYQSMILANNRSGTT
jgi:hypothetical protein